MNDLDPLILSHLEAIERLRMRRIEELARRFGVPKERLIAAVDQREEEEFALGPSELQP